MKFFPNHHSPTPMPPGHTPLLTFLLFNLPIIYHSLFFFNKRYGNFLKTAYLICTGPCIKKETVSVSPAVSFSDSHYPFLYLIGFAPAFSCARSNACLKRLFFFCGTASGFP